MELSVGISFIAGVLISWGISKVRWWSTEYEYKLEQDVETYLNLLANSGKQNNTLKAENEELRKMLASEREFNIMAYTKANKGKKASK